MTLSWKMMITTILLMTMVLSNPVVASASETEYTNTFSLSSEKAITIDGDFSDWADLPVSYEYNWDNSENCWTYGVWVNGECYKTERGTYSTDVRHLMQMYCDGENVYLHIIFSRDYGSRINTHDYQFWIDGHMAAFQLTAPGGLGMDTILTNPAGVYAIEVRHRDNWMSFLEADKSFAYVKLTESKQNDELEMCIPLSEMKRQNDSINIETISTIEFITPNLMYRRLTAVGTSSGPIVLAATCGGVAIGGYFLFRKKKYGHL